MKICEYGCGREAKFSPTKGRTKWCCSESYNSCPSKRKTISNILIGRTYIDLHGEKKAKQLIELMRKNSTGKKCSEETKKKLSISGKRPCSEEKKQKISLANKGQKPTKFAIQKSKEVKTYTLKLLKKKHPLIFKVEKLKEKNLDIYGHCKNHNCINSKEQGGWFLINRRMLFDRISSVENGYGGCYFYCCDKCKQECPLFNLKSDPNRSINKEQIYTSEEYHTFRNEVLNRANYICEYCEELATHVHHSRPQKLEPGFVLDPDFGIACCSTCHYKYGHKIGTECSTGNLASKECK